MSARPYRPGAYRRRRRGNAERLAGAAAGLALAVAAAGHAASGHHGSPVPDSGEAAAPPAAVHAALVAGGSETAFIAGVLADLGAPDTRADRQSMADWGAREGCWGCVGENNQWDTTLVMPGSWNYNTFNGDLHVQSYPTASEGAQATALTLEDGYPLIVAALKTGTGLCANPSLDAEFDEWSGDGYPGVC